LASQVELMCCDDESAFGNLQLNEDWGSGQASRLSCATASSRSLMALLIVKLRLPLIEGLVQNGALSAREPQTLRDVALASVSLMAWRELERREGE
jgi:hypothetical protein